MIIVNSYLNQVVLTGNKQNLKQFKVLKAIERRVVREMANIKNRPKKQI